MKIIYEVRLKGQYLAPSVDYADETLALAAIEAAGGGQVVTFVRGSDNRDRSCALRVYENGAWRGVDISGP